MMSGAGALGSALAMIVIFLGTNFAGLVLGIVSVWRNKNKKWGILAIALNVAATSWITLPLVGYKLHYYFGTPTSQEFDRAIHRQDEYIVNKSLANGVALHYTDRLGKHSVLRSAASSRRLDVLAQLLDRGADADEISELLSEAVGLHDLELAKLALRHGGNPNYRAKEFRGFPSPLELAYSERALQQKLSDSERLEVTNQIIALYEEAAAK